MGFWAWFFIWMTLVVLSLVAIGLIGKSLLNKSLEVAHQIGRVAAEAQKLANLIDSHEKFSAEANPELITPEHAATQRRSFLKAKAKKREDRTRILIKSLKKYDPNESRFH